ncbi:putative ribonuclease H domain, E3 ubiquitin ligase RBR family [Helianthus debilis subsp. tardiflorus]
MFEAEWKRMQKNLKRLMHDQLFRHHILENEWERTDVNLKKRVGLYPVVSDEEQKGYYKVYFKGLVSVKKSCAGVGVAIFDARDRCVFELRKGFSVNGLNDDDDVVELRGLVEGVYAAVMFGLKRVYIYCHSESVYRYVS